MKTTDIRHIHWLHWLIIVGSFALTITAWFIADQHVTMKNETRFERSAFQVVDLLQERMQKYENALWSAAAMIHAQDIPITADAWQRYADSLLFEEKYPGMYGIGLLTDNRQSNTDMAAKSFLNNAVRNILPPSNNSLFINYWSAIHDYAHEQTIPMLELNAANEAHRLLAIDKARDVGKARVTRPITLKNTEGEMNGFIMFVPYYTDLRGSYQNNTERRNEFQGTVYASFLISSLLESILPAFGNMVYVSINDGDILLYDDALRVPASHTPVYSMHSTLDMYGRPWTVHVRSTQTFEALHNSNESDIILIAGIIFDVMLVMIFAVLTRSTSHSLELAHNMSRSVNELKTAMEYAVEGIAQLDQKGRYIYANDAYLKLLDINYNTIINTKWQDYIPAKEHARMRHYIRIARKSHKSAFEISGIRASGETFSQHVTLVANNTDSDDNTLYYFTHDISDRKHSEQEREQLIHQLVASNTELERFAYIASHDMQEPLRMISNFSEMLALEHGDNMENDAHTYLTIICDASRRMQDMVDDLLIYSRVSTLTPLMDNVDMNEEMNHVLENLHELIRHTNAQITSDPLPYVEGNASQLMRLLQNLIANAIKYCPTDKQPFIHIDAVDSEDYWTFRISDNGFGIEEQFIDAVFEPFKRLHSWENIRGSGLGLAVSRKIVEHHHGELTLRSVYGQGSTFMFTILKGKSAHNAA